MSNFIEGLSQGFNHRVSFVERRKNVYQLVAPFYHEDGDMVDIYVIVLGNKIRVCDLGKTLMRLSYSYEIDTPAKEKIFNQIISQNHLNEENGNLYLDVEGTDIYPSVMQLYQVIAKVSNMRLYKREVIKSLFFELLEEFIMANLQQYSPVKDYYPIETSEEYKVDYCFNHRNPQIFLFGVPSDTYARLSAISCLKFQNEAIPFRSVIVLEDLETLSRKDQARLMSVADKQFPSLMDFQKDALGYFKREYQQFNVA
ncbi:MAG: hypothetical protein BWK79_11140 [Beggiatoa sp. IS2]|nr:MAG: hypothetical protein BWK79_11140 [Beggiatoa sp. IS2]